MPYEDVHTAIRRLTEELTARSQPKLPPERELAARLGTSRTTVRKVLAELERQGIIRRVLGRTGGAYLNGVEPCKGPEQVEVMGSGRKVQRDLNRVNSVPAMLKSQGFSTGTRVLAASLEPAPAPVAQFLHLEETDLVASVLRIRFADGDSLSLERIYVSSQRFPTLLESSLEGSLYELFETKFGVTVGRTEETIEAAAAPPQVAALLGLSDGDPLLKLTRRALDSAGTPFEYSVDLFRSDRTRLTVRTSNPTDRVRSSTASPSGLDVHGPLYTFGKKGLGTRNGLP